AHDHRLLVFTALFDQVLDLVLADFHRVVVGQQLLFDGFAVDVGAVGAIEVFDEDVLAHHLQHGMLAADGEVVDHDVVVGPTTQRGLVLDDLDLFDDHTIERHHQLTHAHPLVKGRAPEAAPTAAPPGTAQRLNGHHERPVPPGPPAARTRMSEILSFPPASLAA